MKQKRGEQEAKSILQSKGLEFDDAYFDDNSKESMPDLRFKNGRYLEVTHTLHNYNIVDRPNDFWWKSPKEKLQIMQAANEAYERIKKRDYPRTPDGLTPEGSAQYKRDAKTVKNHFGIDVTDRSQWSEFKCDITVLSFSADNIIREINEKAPKHSKVDTELFIFIVEDEYRCLRYLLDTREYNGSYIKFMNSVINSPFDVIYLCVWDFKSKIYDIDNPTLLKFETLSEQELLCSRL